MNRVRIRIRILKYFICVDPDLHLGIRLVVTCTCTCWLTPSGSAGASQGVSLIIGPRHPRRQTPSPMLASWDGHHIPPVDFVGRLKSLGSLCLPYFAWDAVPSCRHFVGEKVSPYLQPGCLDPHSGIGLDHSACTVQKSKVCYWNALNVNFFFLSIFAWCLNDPRPNPDPYLSLQRIRFWEGQKRIRNTALNCVRSKVFWNISSVWIRICT